MGRYMMVNMVCLRDARASSDTSLCQNPGLRLDRGGEGKYRRLKLVVVGCKIYANKYIHTIFVLRI